jgi:hypothetical protein
MHRGAVVSQLEIEPTQALDLLFQAGDCNPGGWVAHSVLTGSAAKRIATATGDMDPDRAFVLGLLHDIGRVHGPSGLKHVTDGYKYLLHRGLSDCAGVSLSHSFPDANLDSYLGDMDVDKDDCAFLSAYLGTASFTMYDRLIQLCDFLATGEGYCVAEVRMVDVVLRHGVREVPHAKWNAIFRIMHDLNHKIGSVVYSLLPGIAGTTLNGAQIQQMDDHAPEYRLLLDANRRFVHINTSPADHGH